jgi:anti-anti-sigma regulatory factor
MGGAQAPLILERLSQIASRRWSGIVTIHTVDGLKLNVDRGPNWLFVKLRSKGTSQRRVPQIADGLWSIATRHFVYRVVLELDELESLPAGMMAQLVLLRERLSQCGGALKICGMSDECLETLHECHLDVALPNYSTRTAAVMGSGEACALPR